MTRRSRQHVLIDPQSTDGTVRGLHGPSLVKCYNLATVRQRRILHVLRHLSDALMREVNQAVRVAFDFLLQR